MNVAGKRCGAWARFVSDVVEIGAVARGGSYGFERRALLAPDTREAQVQLVTDRPGVQVAVEAGHQAFVVLVVRRVEHAAPGITVEVGDGQRRIHAVLPRVFGAAGHIGGPVVTEVILGAGHAEGVFQLRVAPALCVTGVGIRHLGRFVQGRIDIDHRAALIDHLFLIAQVRRHPQAITPEVQTDADQRRATVFVIDGGGAFALQQIDPRAESVVFAKALAQVQMPADPAIVAVIEGDAAGRHIVGAFGLQVDAAANPAAAGRDTIHESIRSFEQLDPFQRFGGDDLPGQDAVKTVIGNVIGQQRQTADHEHLGEVAKAGGLPHRSVVEQHIAHGLRLLVGDGFGGVAGDAEGQVFQGLVTEHADLRNLGDLTATVGVRVVVAQGADAGGAQLQCTVGRDSRRHGVTVSARADQLETAALKQLREA
ncbi:hypothetical protein D3C84_347510 [compost metagenome]